MIDSVAVAVAVAGFLVVAFRFATGGARYRRPVFALIGVSIACAFLAAVFGQAIIGAIVQASIACGLVAFLAWDERGASKRWWEGVRDPLVLRAPFAGRWRVAAGGPLPARNHHLVASDQVYAYDFLREDAATAGSDILAPVDGVVVGARDGMVDHVPNGRVSAERKRPFGNYVAIDSGRGVVILAHLRQGSVAVAVGDALTAGTVVGACGNSGRTSGPHLHLHAQDRPDEAPFVARAVPIAFARPGDNPRVLEADDRFPA